MSDGNKGYLPSGLYLENIFHERLRNVFYETAVHSWIVDTSDFGVRACFSLTVWETNCNSIPLLPNSDEKLLSSLERFTIVSIACSLSSTCFVVDLV